MITDKKEQDIQEFTMCLLQIGFDSEGLINFLINTKGLNRKEAQEVIDDVKGRLHKGERMSA